MILKYKLKPYSEFSGKGTKKQAMYDLWDRWNISAYPTHYSSLYGSFSDRLGDDKYAWLYTIQVYKRGKYRKNKHYNVKIYRVPLALLEIMRIKVYQKKNGFVAVKY